MSVDMDSEDFLEIVWGKRRGWVDLPAKVNGNWIPYYTEWDGAECGHSISKRIDASLRDGEDLYFSVAQFDSRGRNEREYKPSRWLWADLDEVHPGEAAKRGLTPTIAWESSRGRYQALWKLDRQIGAEAHDRLNQALSYALGADYGGWDLTQVLRLPGTRNWKYKDTPLIQLLWYHEDMVYDPRRVWAKVKGHEIPRDHLPLGGQGGALPRSDLPARAKRLLRAQPDEVVETERSHRLFELERLLIEAGWGEDDIYAAVKETPWHKWASSPYGEGRLRDDIRRAFRKAREGRRSGKQEDRRSGGSDAGDVSAAEVDGGEDGADAEQLPFGLPFVTYSRFMSTPVATAKWQIEGIWTENAHGIIGGEPKTLKTTLALAMGMSIASGKPFLGEFPVHSPGRVLMIQEENSPGNVQDLMHKVAASYGLISEKEVTILPSPEGSIGSTIVDVRFPDDIPFHLLNNWHFDLDDEEHTDRLEESIDSLKPKMVILDPFEKMIGDSDLDRSHEVRRFLRGLMRLRYEYNTAIVLVHHMRKSPALRAGQRMLGTAMLHAWTSSALYVTDKSKKGEAWKRVSIEREFREQGPQNDLTLALRMGAPGSLDFEAIVMGWNQADQLVDLVLQANGHLPVTDAMAALGVKKDALRRRVVGSGLLDYEGGKGRGDTRYIVYRGGENGDSPS